MILNFLFVVVSASSGVHISHFGDRGDSGLEVFTLVVDMFLMAYTLYQLQVELRCVTLCVFDIV
jgi:hypothetical protein